MDQKLLEAPPSYDDVCPPTSQTAAGHPTGPVVSTVPHQSSQGYPPQGSYVDQGQRTMTQNPDTVPNYPGQQPVLQIAQHPQQGYKRMPQDNRNTTQQGTTFVYAPYDTSVASPYPSTLHAPPPDYLAGAVCVTLCCFWPTGAVAIYKALQARSSYKSGNMMLARNHAKSAKLWTIVSGVVGILVLAFIGIFLGIVAANTIF